MKEKKENEFGPQFSCNWEQALVGKKSRYKLLGMDLKTSKNVASGWK